MQHAEALTNRGPERCPEGRRSDRPCVMFPTRCGTGARWGGTMTESTAETILKEERQTLVGHLRQFDARAIIERARRADAQQLANRSWEHLTLGPLPRAADGPEVNERDITLVTALATHLMAQYIADHTKGERREKMERVVARQAKGLEQLFADGGVAGAEPGALLLHLVDSWPEGDRLRLVIDLDFTDPFFPFELKVPEDQFEHALGWIANHIGVGKAIIDSIAETRRDAEREHVKNRLVKVVACGAGGLVLLGAGGWALAPIIGTALGAGAGLSGAAATAHGLALLGGGSLAAGGSGMAGGMFLVTGTGAAAGAVGGGGSVFLYGMGAKQAQLEVVRLQVTYRMTMLDRQISSMKAATVVRNLQQQLQELEGTLEEERELNDRNSRRLDDLEAKIKVTRTAVRWMEAQSAEQAS